MTRHVIIAGLITLAALQVSGCKHDTCKDACEALEAVATSKRSPETAERCLRECSAWPDSLRACVSESRDQRSVEVCLQKAYKLDAERATQRAENAPPEEKPSAVPTKPAPAPAEVQTPPPPAPTPSEPQTAP